MLESNENAKSDIKQHETYVKTFISIGRHRNALNYLEGVMSEKPEWKDMLDSYRVECCWKLGSWDKLKQIVSAESTTTTTTTTEGNKKLEISLQTDNTKSSSLSFLNDENEKNNTNTTTTSSSIHATFNASIGKLFALVAERNEKHFYLTLNSLREQQIGPLSAASMEAGGNSYQRGYEYVVNLQVLQEIESSLSEMLRLRSSNTNDQIEHHNHNKLSLTSDRDQYRNLLLKNLDSFVIEPWEKRVLTMQPSFKHLEPIYNVRIALLNFLSSQLNLDLSKQCAKLWLRLAKIARKAGMYENAYQYMLNAQGQIKSNDSSNLEELLVEKAKWYWQREDKDSALFYLQKGLNELFIDSTLKKSSNNNTTINTTAATSTTNSDLYSKVLLMYTKFSEENGSLDSETIRKNYLEVQRMRKNTEQVRKHYSIFVKVLIKCQQFAWADLSLVFFFSQIHCISNNCNKIVGLNRSEIKNNLPT
jgi:hypothetical protein